MRHRKAFLVRSRALPLQGFALYLVLTIAFWLVLFSANVARALSVTPTGLSFVVVEGGSNPPAQSLSIITVGPTAGSWFASSSGSWLHVTPLTGTTPTSAFVSANVAGLAAGTYTGTVLVISRQTGDSQVVSVLLTVTPQNTQSQ